MTSPSSFVPDGVRPDAGGLPSQDRAQAPAGPALERELRVALAGRMLSDGHAPELTHIVLAAVAGYFAWPWVSHDAVLLWVIAIAAAALVRISLRSRAAAAAADPAAAFRAVRLGVGAVGLAWGMGALLIGPDLPLESLAWLTVLFAGLVSGGTLSLLADPVSFHLLLAPLLSGLCVGIALNGSSGSHGVGVLLVLVYGTAMVLFYRRSHDALVEQVRLAKQLELAEADARRERALLDALLAGAPSAIAILDRAGTVLSVNRSFQATFGYGPEEALGRNIDEMVLPPGEVEGALATEARVREGEVVVTEAWRRRADGTLLFARIAAAPVVSQDALVTFVLYDDVTEARRAREASQRLVRIIEATPDHVAMAGPDGRIRYLNQAGRRMLGLGAEEDLSETQMEDLRPPTLRGAFTEEWLSEMWREGHWSGESALRHRDGHEVPVSLVAIAHRAEDGTPEGWSEIAREASAQVAAREALRAARDAAEQANAAKGALLANTSHEFRTPLTGILGMVDLLLDSDLSPAQRRSAELIETSAEDLLRLVNDLLDLSRLEAAQVDLESAPFDLHHAVHSVVRLQMPRASDQGLELVVDLDPDLPRWVLGDQGRIRQVLSNLLSNALKFTQEGEVVVTATGSAGVGERARIRVSVRDTGVGIRGSDLRRIFEPFRQADVSTTRRFGGSGLGLSIARHLVEAMGGRIEVTSTPGVGSEFSFAIELPLAEPHEPSLDLAGSGIEGVRTLVVDDHTTSRTVTARQLTGAGARVDAAASAPAALETLRDAARGGEPFRLLVSDVVMPDRDGFALAGDVRADPALAEISIVLITSAPGGEDAQRCRKLGVTACLPRPVSRQELLQAALATLGARPAATSSEPARARPASGRAGRRLSVLLAEDQPVNQKVVASVLERRGHRVRVVGTGAAAVEAIRRGERVDIVLMDLQMPEMGGIEATRRIRALGRDTLPIVALTANVSVGEEARCLEAGMNGYLSKPFRADELCRAVERMAGDSVGGEHDEPGERGGHAGAPLGPPDADRPARSTSTGEEPPVDVSSLVVALGGGSEDVVREVLALFVGDGRSRLRAMVEAVARDDGTAAARTAHTMRSGAAGIRAYRMAALLGEAEAAGSAGGGEALARLLEEITEELGRIERFVERLLSA